MRGFLIEKPDPARPLHDVLQLLGRTPTGEVLRRADNSGYARGRQQAGTGKVGSGGSAGSSDGALVGRQPLRQGPARLFQETGEVPHQVRLGDEMLPKPLAVRRRFGQPQHHGPEEYQAHDPRQDGQGDAGSRQKQGAPGLHIPPRTGSDPHSEHVGHRPGQEAAHQHKGVGSVALLPENELRGGGRGEEVAAEEYHRLVQAVRAEGGGGSGGGAGGSGETSQDVPGEEREARQRRRLGGDFGKCYFAELIRELEIYRRKRLKFK